MPNPDFEDHFVAIIMTMETIPDFPNHFAAIIMTMETNPDFPKCGMCRGPTRCMNQLLQEIIMIAALSDNFRSAHHAGNICGRPIAGVRDEVGRQRVFALDADLYESPSATCSDPLADIEGS